MNALLISFFLIAVVIAFVMSILTGILYLQEKNKLARHILELWVSYLVYFFVTYLTTNQQPKIVALATVFWLWRVRVYRLILENISGLNLKRRRHYWILATGFSLGFILGLFDLPFHYYTLPCCFSIFLVGVEQVWRSFLSIKKSKLSALYYVFLVNVFIVYAHIFNYPFLRYNHPNYIIAGYALVIFTIFITAVILPSMLLMEQAKSHALHLEKLVEERTQQLINQSKFSALGEMAAGVAHEINNPLGVISGKAGQLKRMVERSAYDVDNLKIGLEQIENTVFRISRIIKGLRDFSRNSDKLPIQTVTLNSIINETLDLCRERFHHNGVLLRINPIPHVEVNCRSTQISQVLLNLLNNAFDAVHLSHEKMVELEVQIYDQKVAIRVTDSGPGIPDEIKNRIMMPFFTTKEVGKGTGLGLSISKGIIEDHNGKFYLDELIRKTCFVVELPR